MCLLGWAGLLKVPHEHGQLYAISESHKLTFQDVINARTLLDWGKGVSQRRKIISDDVKHKLFICTFQHLFSPLKNPDFPRVPTVVGKDGGLICY